MKKKTLIIGQGLAGSLLAYTLDKYDIDYHIIDNRDEQSCSIVGAGMLNPITGMRMVKTWQCDEIFGYAIPFYKKLENSIGKKIYHEKDIYRPFSGVQYHNDWAIKYDLEGYKKYIKSYYNKETNLYRIKNPYGGLLIQQSGWVDNKILLSALRQRFIKRGRYWNMRISHDNIKRNTHGLWRVIHLAEDYKELMNESFTHIILSCGLSVRDWFDFDKLPFVPLKGELLTIRPSVMPQVILSSGFFCIPISEQLCRIGTTYERDYQDSLPTEKGKEAIISKVKRHILFDFEVLEHVSGVRPSTKDRHPFIGWSKDDNTLGVFTGFGSKGCSLIPYFANFWIKNGFYTGKTANFIESTVAISRYKV